MPFRKLHVMFEADWDRTYAGSSVPPTPNTVMVAIIIVAVAWLQRIPPRELLQLLRLVE